MRSYRVEVEPGFIWEGEAINVSDALLRARAAADPAAWDSYLNRPNGSQIAPPWALFRREDCKEHPLCNVTGFHEIRCKVDTL